MGMPRTRRLRIRRHAVGSPPRIRGGSCGRPTSARSQTRWGRCCAGRACIRRALSTWRRQREAGELEGLRPAKRGRKGKPPDARDKRIAELERKNRRLEAKLAQAETVIVIQKTVASLLGIPLKSSDPEEND